MKSLDKMRAVKEKQEEEWLKYSTVTGVDIGNKFIDQNRTDELSIRVLVKEKNKFEEGERIPQAVDGEILFGIGLECQELLNNDAKTALVSPELRCEFEKNGVSLSEKTKLSKEKDSGWLIDDGLSKQLYTIKEKLNIYRGNDELLFGIELGFQEDLNRDSDKYLVVPKLRPEFAKNGLSLSKNAKVLKEKDGVWRILDADTAFTIKRELSVYEAVKTDVIEREFLLFPDKIEEEKKQTNEDKNDATSEWEALSLKGGIGIGSQDSYSAAGTLGAIVEDRDTKRLKFLTCCHIFDWSGRKELKANQSTNQVEPNEEGYSRERQFSTKFIEIGDIEDKKTDYDRRHRQKVTQTGCVPYRILSESENQSSKPITLSRTEMDTAEIKGVLRYRESSQPQEVGVDCAVIALEDSDKLVCTSEIVDVGRIRGAGEAQKGMEVRKYGQKTKLTYGVVDSVNLTVKIDKPLPFNIECNFQEILNNFSVNQYCKIKDLQKKFADHKIELSRKIGVLFEGKDGGWLIVDKGNNETYVVKKQPDKKELRLYRRMIFTNQIGIVVDFARNDSFGENGDSGSVVVNNSLEAVGLLFACDKRGGAYCAATPIQAVLDELNVEIYDQKLTGLDRDIDDSMKELAIPPPPLSGDGRQFLYGRGICDRCQRC